MELKHLTVNDFDAVVELLDGVFSRKYGRETRFAKLFPRIFTAPRADMMNAHIGAFEGGRLIGTAAMYPIDYVVGGQHIRLIANGNVAVHEDFRGRGVMSVMLDRINEECDSCGDLCYLHGDPVRYGRWGYIGGGIEYKLTFEPTGGGYDFLPLNQGEVPFCLALAEARSDYVVRREDELIPALRSGGREAVAVYTADTPGKTSRMVGCLSLNREGAFVEEFAIQGGIEPQVFAALAAKLGRPLTVRLSGYDAGTLARCRDFAKVEEAQPTLFRVIHPERLREAALAAGVDADVMYAPYLT
ncbi:MAG: GNAT family N-acetyltransferase [Clostridia bacterium]|nr:GNAT family N-acetyltransferase [Clostridia bacterium]